MAVVVRQLEDRRFAGPRCHGAVDEAPVVGVEHGAGSDGVPQPGRLTDGDAVAGPVVVVVVVVVPVAAATGGDHVEPHHLRVGQPRLGLRDDQLRRVRSGGASPENAAWAEFTT